MKSHSSDLRSSVAATRKATTMMTRVMIVGGSGTGKSWLATRLSALSGVPVYHMDQLSWMPGFIHRSTEELDAITREIHAQDQWIIDGGHYETGVERASRAHLLLWVDPPTAVQVAQVAWRSLRWHGKVRPGMGQGCAETFGRHTFDAMTYAISSRQFHQDRAAEIVESANAYLKLTRIRSGREARAFLQRCIPVHTGAGFRIHQS